MTTGRTDNSIQWHRVHLYPETRFMCGGIKLQTLEQFSRVNTNRDETTERQQKPRGMDLTEQSDNHNCIQTTHPPIHPRNDQSIFC